MISSIDQKLIFEMLWWMIIFARRFFTIATCLKNKLKSWREDWINKKFDIHENWWKFLLYLQAKNVEGKWKVMQHGRKYFFYNRKHSRKQQYKKIQKRLELRDEMNEKKGRKWTFFPISQSFLYVGIFLMNSTTSHRLK